VNALECSTVILIDARGVCTVEIADSEGEVHSYSIAPAAPGFDAWACTLTRLDGEGESPYRVSLNLTGSWRCACGDAVYRARKARRFCKHEKAVAPIYNLLRRLLPEDAR
jgi:hypothetical protein